MLDDNADQNDLMGTSRANAAGLLPVHAGQIKDLVAERGLNRELEALPSEKEIARRLGAGHGAHVARTRDVDGARQARRSRTSCSPPICPTRRCSPRGCPVLPEPLRDRFGAEIRTHQLRREIVTTMLVNDLVDTAGISYAYRVVEDVGVGPVDAVRAYVATDAIFRVGEVWRSMREAGLPWRCPTR